MASAVAFNAARMPATLAVGRPAARAAASLQPAAFRGGAVRAATSRRQLVRQQGSAGVIVTASWGAPVEFAAGKILVNEREAEKLQRLTVQIGGGASAYTIAGQYIQAKFGEEGKAGYYAIASPPGADKENGTVELLVKEQPGTAEQLCAAEAGAPLLVSAPMGKGFLVNSIPPTQFPTVLIFATGSGISPIKALIESGTLQAGQRKDVRLYYGVRSAAHLAFAAAIPEWEAAGVKVHPVYSAEGHGYVQDAFVKEVDSITEWSGVSAIMCGQKDMAVALGELLASKGVAKEHILSNF